MDVSEDVQKDVRLTLRISKQMLLKLDKKLEEERKLRDLRFLTRNSYITDLIHKSVEKK